MALYPDEPDQTVPRDIEHLDELTPYGMLLASLGACTALLLNTYARHHDIEVRGVEVALQYRGEATEQIDLFIQLHGDLSAEDRERLFKVSYHCPIHKMLKGGIKVQPHLAEEPAVKGV
jgi:putative redox protein